MATILIGGGLVAMAAGGGVLLARQHAEATWTATEEAGRAARQLDAPTPRWIDERETALPPRPAPTSRAASAVEAPLAVGSGDAPSGRAVAHSTPAAAVETPDGVPALAARPRIGAPDANAEADGSTPSAAPAEEDTGDLTEPRAPASAVEIVASAFRFLDPPEPGAQARLSVQLRNGSELPTGPLRLTLSTRWLSSWRVVAAEPPVLDDRTEPGARRRFDFPGLDAGTEGALELHLVATDDAVDPPELWLTLAADGDDPGNAGALEIGRVRPETVAPRPRPGPARALAIPRLGLRAAVVPTSWEPPSFVVGQLRETANLSEGNTVLIGHLTGLAGNVFARLAELEPGDEIVAISRGLEYPFVVSETMVLPGDDSVPIQPTDTPRLTLMTCIGEWDPIGHDYSHRLWVVAEPPELAETTLSGETPGPLTRQLGLAPALTIVPPDDRGPSPKEVAAAAEPEPPAETPPGAEIAEPSDGARVGSRVAVRGRRTEHAALNAPLWLVVRAEIEGSRWYLYGQPLTADRDGTWAASLELGGGPGVRHTIVVAPVDPATDARLRRHAATRPGEPLSILPDAFEAGARVVVERE